ncbi:energy-coupling factor transporter transmembrane protein EcfT [Alkalibaculum bacchi]|uniref:energy-coupling factor transporter transmembrane component T family protein n=1 Tax=Alkalibaculum bacchi TaxID=645887 RepID=UPI0026F05172|nr:energy-coupling factor transporter transmembrane component T [Alkalibaculum bacchi]
MNTLNPVFKLLGILIPTFLLAAFHNPILNIIVFVICIILMLLSKVSFKRLFLLMLPILLVAVGMFFTGYHFQVQEGAPVNPDSLDLTNNAIWNGMIFSSRVLAYAGLGFLFVLTTNKMELIRSFQQQLHLPPIFAYGLLAAWNIFPNIMEEYKKTRAAFRARGVNTFAISPALLKPMLVKAVLWSEALAIAMESKGFNSNAKRTEYYVMETTLKDLIFPVTTTIGLLFIQNLILRHINLIL